MKNLIEKRAREINVRHGYKLNIDKGAVLGEAELLIKIEEL